MEKQLILSNLISTFLSQKLRLEPVYAFSLASILISYLSYLSPDMFTIAYNWTTNYMYRVIGFVGVVCVCIWMYIKYSYPKKYLKLRNKTYKLSLYAYDDISLVSYYMERNPDAFSTTDLQYGHSHYRDIEGILLPEFDVITKINDKTYEVTGNLIVKLFTKEVKDSKIERVYVALETDENCLKPKEYFDKMKKFKEDVEKQSVHLLCKYVKLMSQNSDNKIAQYQSTIFYGLKDTKQERYTNFMESYFSPARDYIWKRISKVHFSPSKYREKGQAPTASILVHGPPGTGKSTLAYRLAVALGRNLISLNLLDFLNSKHQLYQILMSAYVGNERCKPNQYIILLEEFDNVIRYLEEHDKQPDFFSKAMMQCYMSNNSDPNDSDDDKTNKPDKSEKKPVIKAGDSYKLRLGDLLEILQGAVPIDGLIIIATTNDYEYIRKTLPALVRPGRLTPVLVDYLDWETLQEMSMFYFNEHLTIPERKINYPTSGLVEIALHCSSREEFENELDKLTQITQKHR